MKFTKVIGPAKGERAPLRKQNVRRRDLPEVTRNDEGPLLRGPAARRNPNQIKLGSYLILSVALSAVLFVISFLGDRGYLARRRQLNEIAVLKAEVESLDVERAKLENEIQRLQGDPDAIEKVAREELNLVRPGDVVLMLPAGWQDRVKSGRPQSTGLQTAPSKPASP